MAIDRDAILKVFFAEAEEDLAAMEQALVALEARPDDAETLGTFFRMAHTLKGNAAAFDFTALSELAHALEDLLDKLRSRSLTATPAIVTVMLGAVDLIKVMVANAAAGKSAAPAGYAELIQQLGQAQLPIEPAAPSAAAVPSVPQPKITPSSPRNEPPEESTAMHPVIERRTLRVDLDALDRMLEITGEILIARGRLAQMIDDLGRPGERLLEAHVDAQRLYGELQGLVMKLRMVPIGPTFQQQARTVRDAATVTGKLVRLVTTGDDVELDTTVIDHVRDPLTHMVRNAVDHGIETPDERRRAGKDATGTLALRAFHDAGSLVVQVADDGAGLDKQRIVERGRALGLVAADDPTDEQAWQLVFEPGFSTAKAVTALSGRGVGMDVVRRNVEAIRGSISIDSRAGKGTTMTLRLPLTMAIIDGFVVGAGGESYVLPVDAVLECLELGEGEHTAAGSGVLNLRGAAVPYVRLRELFALPGHAPARESVVIVKHDAGRAGLAVDQLLGASQAVIKPLGAIFDGLPGLAGSTILGTGQVALILDVPGLLRKAVGHRSSSSEM